MESTAADDADQGSDDPGGDRAVGAARPARPWSSPAARHPSGATVRGPGWHQTPAPGAAAPETEPASVVLPAGFAWGVGTAAHAVEGGTTAGTWSAWELRPRPDGGDPVAGGGRCGRAAGAWDRFDADLALLVALRVRVYRFGVDWSRVEPLPGHVDVAALERYRAWCTALRAHGITPLVTLHHGVEPQWTAERGGFAHPATTDAWLRFVGLCLGALGDVVDRWVTLHAPVPYALKGWLLGTWPPGRQDPRAAAEVLDRLLVAHARAYAAVHEADRPGRRHAVGLAHHLAPVRPARPLDPGDRLAARRAGALLNDAVPRALRSGVLRIRLPGATATVQRPALRHTQDWFGVEAGPPVRLRRDGSGATVLAPPPAGSAVDDLGRELDPAALATVVRRAGRAGLPVLVTGHGAADGGVPDDRRRRWLGASLAGLAGVVRSGADVRGYVHAPFLDGFEWEHGWTARRGLVRVEGPELRRVPTSSALWYARLAGGPPAR